MRAQQPWSYTFGFQAERPTPVPQPFSLTLYDEGVGCAVCHLRDGAILGRQEVGGPHPVKASSTALGSSEGCAACHQLEADGVAVYDTFGEWSRSPYADAGVGCLDCHGPHGDPDGLRAISILVDLDTGRIVRGGAPIAVHIQLQNSGAGHSWPSGSPYQGARLIAELSSPAANHTLVVAPFQVDLARDMNGTDTRLAAGATRDLTWSPALPQDAPAGPWTLRVALLPTTRGEVSGPPHIEQHLVLTSD